MTNPRSQHPPKRTSSTSAQRAGARSNASSSRSASTRTHSSGKPRSSSSSAASRTERSAARAERSATRTDRSSARTSQRPNRSTHTSSSPRTQTRAATSATAHREASKSTTEKSREQRTTDRQSALTRAKSAATTEHKSSSTSSRQRTMTRETVKRASTAPTSGNNPRVKTGGASHSRKKDEKQNPRVATASVMSGGAAAKQLPKGWVLPQAKEKKKHPVRNAILAVLAIFIVLAGVMGFSAYNQFKEIKTDINTITSNVKSASSSLKSGEYEKCATSMRSTASNLDSIKEALNSPAFTFFSFLPVVGHDINNAKIVLDNASIILDECVVPACEGLATGATGGFITSDKTINYSAINAVIDPIKNNATKVSGAVATIRKACDFNLPQIAEKVDPVKDKLDSVQNVIDVVGKYAPQVQSMLGSNGDRKYLLVAQNTAEMRSTGGFPGSTGTIGFQGGKIKLGTFASGKEMIGDRPADCPVTDLDNAIYPLGVKYTMDTGYDAHFPNSAKVWVGAYANKVNDTVDGIISISPSMVQSVLKICGEITLEDGTTLNGDNATKVLQHDIYWKYLSGKPTSADNDTADALFASAAKKSFDKLFSKLNTSTLLKLVKTLPDAIDNREFLIYMVDENEQKAVEELGCSGSLSVDSSKNKLGIFCGVRSSCKLGWWLDKSFDIQKTGDTTYHVTATFGNTITSSEVSTGGTYILGLPADGELGNILPWIYIFAPSGGSISNMQVNSKSYGAEYTEENRQLIYLEKVNLPAQSTATVTFDLTVPAGTSETLEVETNPVLTKYR